MMTKERKNPMDKQKNNASSEEIQEEEAAPALEQMDGENTKKQEASKKEKAEKKVSPEEEKIKNLEEENAALNEKFLRICAEYDNYKKRTQKEKQELSGYTKALCIKEILTVLDNFERALASECKDPEFKKGMEMICSQLVEKIGQLGAVEIDALHQPFNPELHNAISQMEDKDLGENIVSQVLQKGYTLDGKVVRHAMVIVANP